MKEVSSSSPATDNRTIRDDPNLPRWVCQRCRKSLCVISSGVESHSDKFLNDSSRSGMQGSSLMGSSGMDHSFVVLPRQRNQGHGGVPPRPPKAMEESFVVLPPPAASVYKPETSPTESGGTRSPSPRANTFGFHSCVTVLNRASEIATGQTQVEQPLCLECMRVLCDEFDKVVEDVSRDIRAYEGCLRQMEGERSLVLSEADFFKEKSKVEKEQRRMEAAISETEKQIAMIDIDLMELESKSKLFKDLEEQYWHDFNSFQFQITSYQEERDAILAKIEVSQAHLESLKRTNVLNDAFFISNDGEFGTINTFRLGRLPKIRVEWDEINAAWGQACLLLHTMMQYLHPKFSCKIKILPMGSYPQIMDSNNNKYELHGPVNLFWSTGYDKAMTLFLTCLKEFAVFANSMDQANGMPPQKCFNLPYKIENDKVGGNYSITHSFNKPEHWTKALKYTLCNLKWVMFWFIGNTSFHPLSTMAHAPTKTPNLGSLFEKHSSDSKTDLKDSR